MFLYSLTSIFVRTSLILDLVLTFGDILARFHFIKGVLLKGWNYVRPQEEYMKSLRVLARIQKQLYLLNL